MTIGNAWVDLTRITLYVLLPISLVFALFLVSQGVIQNFDAYKDVTTLEITRYDAPKLDDDGQPLKDDKGVAVTEPVTTRTQTLAMGPVASQDAIKELGTNGGGFFNANSAHPYENPTPLSNFLEMLPILLIPAALCLHLRPHGRRHAPGLGRAGGHDVLFVAHCASRQWRRTGRQPAAGRARCRQASGNMEGKEVRFGIAELRLCAPPHHRGLLRRGQRHARLASRRWAAWCRCGNMMLGEVVFGGVGSGLYGMLVFAVIAVFVAGLMIGRTPEYLGKKIEAFEMKMVSIAILVTPLLVLAGTAVAVMTPAGVAGIANPGAHGFSRNPLRLHLGRNNNGSAFAGLSRQHALLQHDARPSPCGWAASA